MQVAMRAPMLRVPTCVSVASGKKDECCRKPNLIGQGCC